MAVVFGGADKKRDQFRGEKGCLVEDFENGLEPASGPRRQLEQIADDATASEGDA
jgi:hypothetical protein